MKSFEQWWENCKWPGYYKKATEEAYIAGQMEALKYAQQIIKDQMEFNDREDQSVTS